MLHPLVLLVYLGVIILGSVTVLNLYPFTEPFLLVLFEYGSYVVSLLETDNFSVSIFENVSYLIAHEGGNLYERRKKKIRQKSAFPSLLTFSPLVLPLSLSPLILCRFFCSCVSEVAAFVSCAYEGKIRNYFVKKGSYTVNQTTPKLKEQKMISPIYHSFSKGFARYIV